MGAPVGTGGSSRPAETAPRGTGPTARERPAEDVTEATGGHQVKRYPGFDESGGPWQPVASPVTRGGGSPSTAVPGGIRSTDAPGGVRSTDAPGASAGGPSTNGARETTTGAGGVRLPGQGLEREAPSGASGRTGMSRPVTGSEAPRLSSDRPPVSAEGPAQGSTRSGASEASTVGSTGQRPESGGSERARQTRSATGSGVRRPQDDELSVNSESTESTAPSSLGSRASDDAESAGRRADTLTSSVAGDEPLEGLAAPDAPAHDPNASNPVRDAPAVPSTPPARVGEGLAQRSEALAEVARESGMSRDMRREFTDAIDEAIANRQWTSVVERLSAFRHTTGAHVLNQRLKAFDSHVERGFDRFEELGVDRAEWQAKVDAVQEARRGEDRDQTDVNLRDYTNFVEQQLPAEVLTGRDAAQPYDATLENLRRELAQTSDPRRARDIDSELNELLDDAAIQDRFDGFRGASTDEVETALLRRVENAATPEQAARAMEQLEQHRTERELQDRLDSILADEAEEAGPGSGHALPSEDDLRARLDTFKGDQDDHAKGLQKRIDGDDAADAARAQEELHEYRMDQGLQGRLDRLRPDGEREAPPSGEELAERLNALGEGTGDARTAQLHQELRDAPDSAEAVRRNDALEDHLVEAARRPAWSASGNCVEKSTSCRPSGTKRY